MSRGISAPLFVLGLVLCLHAASAEAPEVFSHPSTGFELTKPKTWIYLTTAEIDEAARSIQYDSPEFAEFARKYAITPLVMISKFKEPYDDVNPMVDVYLRPVGPFKGKRPEQILSLALPILGQPLKDVKVVQAPIETTVSGLAAGYARMQYTLELTDGRSFPTTTEIWIVPRGEHYFIISAGTRQDESNGKRSELKAIVDTIKIKP